MIARASTPRPAFRLLSARSGSRAAASLFRATGMFGKDLLHLTGTFLLMLGLPVFLLFLSQADRLLNGKAIPLDELRNAAGSIYLVMLVVSAFVFGLALSFGEVESRTIPFLDKLPARPYSHFRRKLMTALLLLAVWVAAEGLILGVLGRQGLSLLWKLAVDPPSLFSRLWQGGGILMVLTQTLSLVLTGLISGCLCRSLLASVVTGFAGFGMLLAAGIIMSSTHSVPYGTPDFRWQLITTAWCVLMVLAWPRAFRWTEFRRSDAAARVESSSRAWMRLTGLLNFRLHGLPFDPPNRSLLRVPFLLLTVISGVLSHVLPRLPAPASDGMQIWVLLLGGAVALLGSASWLPEEREAGRFFLFSLPVSRARLFWPRMATLFAGNAVLGTVTAFSMGWGIYLLASPETRRTLTFFEVIHSSLFLLIITTVVSIGLLGALFRLFFRNTITPAVFAYLVGGCWAVLSAITLENTVSSGRTDIGSGLLESAGDQATQLIWNLLLPVALPLLTTWLAFCHSRLLELPERTRNTLGLILFFALLLWGGLLLTASPAHFSALLAG